MYTFTEDGTYNLSGSFNYATVWASGSFGGGTLEYQVGPDEEYFITPTDASLTSEGTFNVWSGMPKAQLKLTGATSPDIVVYVLNANKREVY